MDFTLKIISFCLLIGLVYADEYHDDDSGQPLRRVQQIERDWFDLGQKELSAALDLKRNLNRAKNVILFIGDGMGVSTTSAARIWNMQHGNKKLEDSHMAWEAFPHAAFSKTYSTTHQTPDSAGTATAFLAGVKTGSGVLGVNQAVQRGNCSAVTGNEVKSILKYSHQEGKWTGIVTTARVTHATPAAAYAHSADRNWEATSPDGCKDIASQLVEDNDYIRVILGGGRASFRPNDTMDNEHPEKQNWRFDGRDLIQEWKANKTMANEKFRYVENRTQFDSVSPADVDYLFGMFERSHMQYEADRSDDQWGEPSLAEMTEKAIQILKRGSKGFFLEVESGRIDHAHHDTNAYRSLADTVAMSDAVKKARELTDDKDTLIIVSADHSHVFTLGGYPEWDNPILGVVGIMNSTDGKPYTTLAYTNGPGYHLNKNNTTHIRKVLSTAETLKKDYLQDTNVPLDSETHAGEDVGIYATGPMSHLFHGTHEQSYIAHVMMYASCVGPNKAHCQGGPKIPNDCPYKPVGTAPTLHSTSFGLLLVAILALLSAL